MQMLHIRFLEFHEVRGLNWTLQNAVFLDLNDVLGGFKLYTAVEVLLGEVLELTHCKVLVGEALSLGQSSRLTIPVKLPRDVARIMRTMSSHLRLRGPGIGCFAIELALHSRSLDTGPPLCVLARIIFIVDYVKVLNEDLVSCLLLQGVLGHQLMLLWKWNHTTNIAKSRQLLILILQIIFRRSLIMVTTKLSGGVFHQSRLVESLFWLHDPLGEDTVVLELFIAHDLRSHIDGKGSPWRIVLRCILWLDHFIHPQSRSQGIHIGQIMLVNVLVED